MFVIVVTGGRDYKDSAAVFDALNELKPDLVLHGGATGADWLAKDWCRETNTPYIEYPAQWNLGKAAGPIRNGHMADDLRKYKNERHRTAVVVFPGGAGTASMVNHAERRGLKVIRPTEKAPTAQLALA